MWFKTKPADVSFADRARHHFIFDFTVPASPAEAFAAVVNPSRFASWFPDYDNCRFLTAEPQGVGSVREVRLKRIAVKERVLVHEPGQRFTFTITSASLPLLARMVEDFRFERTAGGDTRVLWTVAYQPRTALVPLHAVVRPIFGRLFEDATHRLREHLSQTRIAAV